MGWGRTILLGDIGNRLDIGDCDKNIRELKIALMQMHQDDQSQDEELLKLRRENDELKLYIAALIRLLINQGALTAEDITRMVEIIDAEDGAMDNKKRDGKIL